MFTIKKIFLKFKVQTSVKVKTFPRHKYCTHYLLLIVLAIMQQITNFTCLAVDGLRYNAVKNSV